MSSQKVFRHEFKYYINFFEYQVIRNRLKRILSNDTYSNSNGNYHIRSLYFDDLHNSALYEKQSGILARRKFRIRIYNLSDKVIKLEKKSRIGQFINKESIQISKDDYQKIINKDFCFLKDSKFPLLNEFYFHLTASKIKPDVIVDYVREAYTSKISKIRITIDKNLRTGLLSTSLFDKKSPTVDVIEKPLYVLEVKYNNFLPDFVKDAIQLSSSQRYAISKFVICKKFNKNNNWEDN
tara:strand:+ start:6214 stop:6927 length:714 start_codon:yes stop_codon:yes gene_type:complete